MKANQLLRTVKPIVLNLFFVLSFLLSGCESKKCTPCSGSGISNCYRCSGTSKVNCSYCNGQGKQNCTYCAGQGTQNCTSCAGSGKEYRYDFGYDYANGGQYHYYYDRFPCRKCGQSGRIKCSNYSCKNGKIECTNYSCDDGKVKCLNYSCENGKTKCPSCDGTGKDKS